MAISKKEIDTLANVYNDCISTVTKTALDIVEREARLILQENKDLGEFIMGMGTWFFTTKITGEANYDTDEYTSSGELSEFIAEWDEELCLTGNPMRFTAKGKKRTNW